MCLLDPLFNISMAPRLYKMPLVVPVLLKVVLVDLGIKNSLV